LIPIIDLFAGPGGLGEGFALLGLNEGSPYFKIKLSVEKDVSAHRTLKLRSFFRQFPFGHAPEEYYFFLRGELNSEEELYKKFQNEANQASQEARLFELGSGSNKDEELDCWIREAIIGRTDWVLIGGPPCQAYSLIGRARKSNQNGYKPEEDKKNYLYREYLKIIAKHKPAVFVMENVKGLLSSRINGNSIFGKVISDLQQPVNDCAYIIHSLSVKSSYSLGKQLSPTDYVIESERHGIPQARHRVILLGIREDLSYIEPETLQDDEQVTLIDVLGNLPEIRSGVSKQEDKHELWSHHIKNAIGRRWMKGIRKRWGNELHEKLIEIISTVKTFEYDRGARFIRDDNIKINKLEWWYKDERLKGICNHETRTHMPKDLWRYLFAAAFAEVKSRSPRLYEFPPDLLPKHKSVKTGDFDDRFRVQLAGRPSTTVTSHISKDGHYFIHPDPYQCRSLTVREAARLQTFPDNYFFCGNRTQQYIQVGNAVPPFLAYQIAKIVRDILEKK